MLNTHEIKRAAQAIQKADRMIISAGAGMGVDSGLPDFRGVNGFWRAFPALEQLGQRFESMANPVLLDTHPELAWGFYGLRLNSYRAVIPHDGFYILGQWAQAKSDDYFIFTSNVDGQFQKAGFDETRIFECHGSIHYLQCSQKCTEDIWPTELFTPVVDEKNCLLLNCKPRCPHCGALARPNILMFNDGDWISWRSEFQSTRLREFLGQSGHTVLIEIGAGTAIPTVRNFSQRLARNNDVRLIRINLTEAQVEQCKDISLTGGALETLSTIDAVLNSNYQ